MVNIDEMVSLTIVTASETLFVLESRKVVETLFKTMESSKVENVIYKSCFCSNFPKNDVYQVAEIYIMMNSVSSITVGSLDDNAIKFLTEFNNHRKSQ